MGDVQYQKTIQKLKEQNISIKDFFNQQANFYKKDFSFLNKTVVNELNNITKNKLLVKHIEYKSHIIDQLNKENINLIFIDDNGYPAKLKESLGLSSPRMLFLKGNENLMSETGIGIVGTRNPGNEGKILTQELSKFFLDKKFTIISGFARGIDFIAHKTGLFFSGNTIMVLPYGMKNLEVPKYYNKHLDDGNLLIVSQFPYDEEWSSSFAIIRNKTICGLVKSLFVVHANKESGSLNCGLAGLTLGKPVYTFDLSPVKLETPEGNLSLISKGANEIKVIERWKKFEPSFEDIYENIKSFKYEKPETKKQLDLFDL